MVVGRETVHGTIGGGSMEYIAIDEARDLLAGKVKKRQLRVYDLGPDMGQCCGGRVWLLFEILSSKNADWLDTAVRQLHSNQPVLLQRDLDKPEALPACLSIESSRQAPVESAIEALVDLQTNTVLVEQTKNVRFVLQRFSVPSSSVVVFGAGHVGQALVRALIPLPLQIYWIDSRAGLFPRSLPSDVRVLVESDPERVLQQVPGSSIMLVMTFSHAQDFRICESVLRNQDFLWLGMIGSQSKKRSLQRFLQQAGLGPNQIDKVQCPIGIPGIAGKQPAVIAASVVAQCLVMMQQEQTRQVKPAVLVGDSH